MRKIYPLYFIPLIFMQFTAIHLACAQEFSKRFEYKSDFSSLKKLDIDKTTNRSSQNKISIFALDNSIFESLTDDQPDRLDTLQNPLEDQALHYDDQERTRKAERVVRSSVLSNVEKLAREGDLRSIYKAAKNASQKMNNMIEINQHERSENLELNLPVTTFGIDTASGLNPAVHIGKDTKLYYDWRDKTARLEIFYNF